MSAADIAYYGVLGAPLFKVVGMGGRLRWPRPRPSRCSTAEVFPYR